MTVKEAADKWMVSETWVSILCKQDRVKGAVKIGKKWYIPDDTLKPIDSRIIRKRHNYHFKFVDLFAGIGGFHQAMRYLGGECQMAAEINQECVKTYELNFTTNEGYVRGDVNKIPPDSIGRFDVLCAGFPCQPFSKAGMQQGFNDEKRGNLFYKIMDILDAHQEVKFIILENVRNLADKSENWDIITSELGKRNFYITEKPIILSPSDFGIPQIRERVYILGIRKDIVNEDFLKNGAIHLEDLHLQRYFKKCKMGDANCILEKDVDDSYMISTEREKMILAWEEFRKGTNIKTVGFPIWIDSFGVGYENTEAFFESQGFYEMPKWKQNFLRRNRNLYLENMPFINEWIAKYDMMNQIKLYKKFEWNCGTDVESIYDTIIQIRQSGIRVKRPTFYPSLVAIVNTPIIWDKNKMHFRYITPREAANLQSFRADYKFQGTNAIQYRQLGNSVNVRILKILGENLFNLAIDGWDGVDIE